MRKIGFHGGHTIYELGPAPDMMLFFDCLKTYAEQDHPEQDWSLLTDRLYRRYLRREEIDKASTLMEQVRQIFAGLPASAIDWDTSMLGNAEKPGWIRSSRRWRMCSANTLRTSQRPAGQQNSLWKPSTFTNLFEW